MSPYIPTRLCEWNRYLCTEDMIIEAREHQTWRLDIGRILPPSLSAWIRDAAVNDSRAPRLRALSHDITNSGPQRSSKAVRAANMTMGHSLCFVLNVLAALINRECLKPSGCRSSIRHSSMTPSKLPSSTQGGPFRRPKRRIRQLAASPPPRFPFLAPPPAHSYSRHSRRNKDVGEGPSNQLPRRISSNRDVTPIVISDDDEYLLPVMPPRRQLEGKHPKRLFEPTHLEFDDGRLPNTVTVAPQELSGGPRPIPVSKPSDTVPTFPVLSQQRPQHGVDSTRTPPMLTLPPFDPDMPADAGRLEQFIQAWSNEVLELHRSRMDEWLTGVSFPFKVALLF